MEFRTHQNGPSHGINSSSKLSETPVNSFTSFVDPTFGTFVIADSSSAGQDNDAAIVVKQDIEFIRENGLIAFIEENHKRKLAELKEELRAEMLGNTGLTEESLALMSEDQRGRIEEMIAEFIQQRLTAEAALNGGNDAAAPLDPAENPSILAAALGQAGRQILTGNTGMAVGRAISDAVSGTDETDPADRQNLPQ